MPVAGAHDVVNAISLYIERGTETFRTVHCAERVEWKQIED
jgi:hypothetical protein